MSIRPLPITAVGICSPLGGTLAENRDALWHGKANLVVPPVEVPFETVVGQVHTELPQLPTVLSDWSTRTTRIAKHMIDQMHVSIDKACAKWEPHRIGIILGTSTAGADVTELAYREYLKDGALPDDYDVFKHHTYGALLHVVRELANARGPAWMISTACTSSAKPLASAQRLIDAGIIDAAIVGGIDTLCRLTLRGFHSLDALSSTPCRPFSGERNGLNIGEGGGFLLIEREGAPIAMLEGVGETSDAYHVSAPHPEGLGAQTAMEMALSQAGASADSVDYVNAHGTGTRLNDAAESKGIATVFGTNVPVVSTKSYTGHLLGAAGGVEAVFSVLAIQEGFIPPSLRATPVDENANIHVNQNRWEGRCGRVVSNSFAFGGSNISVLFGAPR